MSELIANWMVLILTIATGTLFMMGLFAISAIIVTKIGENHIYSKAIISTFSVINVVYNMTLGSLLCLQLPKSLGEPTTRRLKRYKRLYSKNSTGIRKWRWNIANGVCMWLNLFDPDHC